MIYWNIGKYEKHERILFFSCFLLFLKQRIKIMFIRLLFSFRSMYVTDAQDFANRPIGTS